MEVTRRDLVPDVLDNESRARGVLKTMIRNQFLEGGLPNDLELTRLLRLPKSAIHKALQGLQEEGLVKDKGANQGYEYLRNPLNKEHQGTIAFVINIEIFKGWYNLFQDWLIGLDQVAKAQGYDVRLVSNISTVEEKLELLKGLREEGVEGFVFASKTEKPVCQWVTDNRIPAVIVGNATLDETELTSISSDNRHGVRTLLDHLIGENHRHIAFYGTGQAFHDGFRERSQAYEQYMRLMGLVPMRELMFSEAYHPLIGQEAAERYQKMENKPTAILCASDREAFDLVSAFNHINVDVPKDVSLVGFGNNHYGHYLEPEMTTMDIHGFSMGHIAGRHLWMELTSGKQLPVKILMPTNLVVRKSTQALPLDPSSKAIRELTSEVPVEASESMAL